MQLLMIYIFLAIIASIANIGSQEFFLRLWPWPLAIPLSIAVGTGTGLLLKYVLDKKYIFKYQAKNIARDSQLFLLYSLMGLFTTSVFWLFEFGFDYLFNDKYLRYLGAAIGLAIGYAIKYRLDKHFVFRSEHI